MEKYIAQSRETHTDVNPYKEVFKEYPKARRLPVGAGCFRAMYIVVQEALALSVIPVYATIKRNTVEKKIEGETVKTSIFEHVMFRKYGV